MTHSKNQRAADICGLRNTAYEPFDLPHDLGYICPVCKIENDELLDWSEYNTFLWCGRCNKDFPSCFCLVDMDKSIDRYLDCINSYKAIK